MSDDELEPVGLAPTDKEAVTDTVEDRDPVLVRVFDRVPDIVMDDVANPVPVPEILAVPDSVAVFVGLTVMKAVRVVVRVIVSVRVCVAVCDEVIVCDDVDV